MEHKSLTINHRLESWVYVDDADRTGATGFVFADIGRIAYQSDTGQYWRLTATTPTWSAITSVVSSVFGRTGAVTAATNDYSYAQLSGKPVYASLQTGILSGTVAGGTNKMLGLGATAFLTPDVTGKVYVAITVGAYFCSGGAYFSLAQLAYGSGTAPANGDAETGTVIGSYIQTPVGPNVVTAASVAALITGLTVGTQYWFDLLAISSNAGGTANVLSVTVAAVELP